MMDIRLLTADDEEKLNEFFSVMGGESRAFFNRNDGNRQSALRYLRDPKPSVKYWISEEDGIITGLVFLWDLDTSIPWLGIAVREELKGRHLGRELISFVQDYAREHGKGGIQLTTHIANMRGQALYEAMGFRNLGFHLGNGEFYYLFRYPADT